MIDGMEDELQKIFAEATQEAVDSHFNRQGAKDSLFEWNERTAEQFAPMTKTADGIKQLITDPYFLGLGDYVYPSVLDDIIELFEERKRRPVNLVLFIEGIGSGKTCVVGSTLVTTASGIIPISEIAPIKTCKAPTLVSCNGGFLNLPPGEGLAPISLEVATREENAVATNLFKRSKALVRKVSLNNGLHVTGTLDHPLLVIRKCEQKLIPIKDIVVGDWVGVVCGADLWGNEVSLPAVKNRSLKLVTLPTVMTPEVAYIMGVLVGDSDLIHRSWTTITTTDLEITERFRAFAQSLGTSVRLSSSKEAIWSFRLWLLWRALGLCHRGSNKRIPDCIMRAPKWAVKEFISGLFDVSGNVNELNTEICFNSKSSSLVTQLQCLLLNFGICTTVSHYDHSTLMHIRGKYVHMFQEEIGFKVQRKADSISRLKRKRQGDFLPPMVLTSFSLYKKIPPELRKGLDAPTKSARSVISTTVVQSLLDRCPEELHTDLDYQYLSSFINSKIKWSFVKSIENAGEQDVYDLEVPGPSTFTSNAIVSSNTKFSVLQWLQWFELSMHPDPQAYFRLIPGSTIALINLSRTESQARRVAFGEVWRRFQCPFVRDYFTPNPRFSKEIQIPQNNTIIFAGTSSAMSALGYNLFGGGIDEACFLEIIEDSRKAANKERYDAAEEIYNAIWDRMTSRFMVNGIVPGFLVMFSSPRYPEDFLERKIRQAVELGDESGIFFRRRSTWSAKGKVFYPSGEYFYVNVDTVAEVPEQDAIQSGDLIFLDNDDLPPKFDKMVKNNELVSKVTDRGIQLIPTGKLITSPVPQSEQNSTQPLT